jgi:membrane associated rhomboid family serine protease
MRRIFAALLGLLIGYPVFAFAGYWAISLFSSNGFDRSVEASMTAVFAIGPAGAVVGLIAGLVWGGPRRQAVASPRSDETM